MSVKFLHTADWQLGKPFAGVEDVQKRALLQNERLAVIKRLAEKAREHGAEFVLVAGDLFDSPRATKATVSAACSAIGAMELPVFAIPGNHDHGGPGSLWEQPFFQQEREHLAPNLRVLLKAEPVDLANAVLFPCPLFRRRESIDPTRWLSPLEGGLERFGSKARIVLAHGSVQEFTSQDDDEDAEGGANQVDLARLPAEEFDYIALGDWHGMKQVGANAWYAGTPELDRFPKGEANAPGHALLVTAQRKAAPSITPVRIGRFGWHELAFSFADDAGVEQLSARVEELVGTRAGEDVLRLELRGSLGFEAGARLAQKVEAWEARLLRLKLSDETTVAPSATEVEALTRRAEDPLISRVALALVERARGDGEDAAVARVALRELHALCLRP